MMADCSICQIFSAFVQSFHSRCQVACLL